MEITLTNAITLGDVTFKKINHLFTKSDCHIHSTKLLAWDVGPAKFFKSSKRERQMLRGLRVRVIRRWISPVTWCMLRREWQKGLTAFRRPFKPPRRGPTPDRKRRSAEQTGRPADRRTDRPAGYRLTSFRTARPSSSRAIERACSIDLLGCARKEDRRNSRCEQTERRYADIWLTHDWQMYIKMSIKIFRYCFNRLKTIRII